MGKTTVVWIDIENPPQVQYLAPFHSAFAGLGCEVVLTAIPTRITLDLLRHRGLRPIEVDAPSATTKIGKIGAVLARTWRLSRTLRGVAPVLCLATSRSAHFAARALGVPSFSFCDYEYVDLRSARLARSYVLHPDVISTAALVDAGLRRDRLLPFPGLKEAITFANGASSAVRSLEFPGAPRDAARVLFRPPGETTHYFVRESLELSLAVLRRLAERDDVLVVYVPREAGQMRYLDDLPWANTPVAIERGVPFLELLASVDAVVSSGGTMLREAAYLGIPAYSTFRSRPGQVDRYLESLGRLTFIGSEDEADRIRPTRGARHELLPARSPDIVGEITSRILTLASDAGYSG